MRRHVGAEKLARFGHGDLSRRRNSRISAHLSGCARCRELNAGLADVSALLASAHPPPIPEHLAVRISGALAAEAARRSVRPAAGTAPALPPSAPPAPPAPAGTSPGPGQARRGPLPEHRWPGRARAPGPAWLPRLGSSVALRALAAAAALALIAGGAYQLTLHAGNSPAPASGPAARRPASSGGNAAAGVPAPGPALRYQHAGRPDSVTPIATDTDFTPEKLSSQVAAELARYGTGSVKGGLTPGGPPVAGGPAAAPDERSTFGNMPLSALQGCVNRIAAGGQVLLVDVARYRGAPATIVVTVGAAGGPEQAWVVGPGCSASGGDVLARTALPGSG